MRESVLFLGRYSLRNAVAGSTRVARQAGIAQAASDTASSKIGTVINVAGSSAPTPNNA